MESIYTALDVGSYEIRLLTILPGDDNTTICCTLQNQSLLSKPKYTALSYCWGDANVTVPIIVDGKNIEVTVNLRDALLQLRIIGVKQIWADAVCINQKDAQEKSLQVGRMDQVYSNAAQTYTWLGKEGSDRAAAGLMFLGRISSNETVTDSIQHTHNIDSPARSDHMSEGMGNAGADHNESSACPSFRDLEDLLRRDYWGRRWIIQEVAAAQQVEVACGTVTIDLKDLISAIKLCKRSKYWSLDMASYCTNLDQIIQIRGEQRLEQQETLCKNIVKTQHFSSKDDRDKVFALIGISSDGKKLIQTPNYFQNFESMLRELAIAVFRANGNFNTMVLDRHHRDASPNQPSWVPHLLALEDP
ncbi:hypothetical protein PFICI_08701 [Pestalotiopsis fici W106-1]|uniref:Heterokaryon incompatibility domain-containing protein n=1 Tax=Pestalotiopsis fici (strain W106-1 / CGMCC3.15140) TaxID=1229662 RepID=W3WY95_PESFW|nr:uncharacterized protein PFICI_08701 [Pestalotiopsis fici W106-1]ETS78848.1 hypothetical protein PFICI_08701 [Pestalotiopsis fici W106-1]